MASSVEEFVQDFHYPLSPSLSSSTLFFWSPQFYVFLSLPHMLTHILIFSFSPSSAAIVLYQLQLTTSQVGLRDILDHGGAASSPSASNLLTDSSPRPRWGLVPGRAERHLAKPQKHFQLQTAWCSTREREFRPKVEELTKNYCTAIDIFSEFYNVYFNHSTKHMFICGGREL